MKLIGIALLPLAYSKIIVKRETVESQESILPSAFWEPTAVDMRTTAKTTGDAITAYLGTYAGDMLNHGCHCSQFRDPHHNSHEVSMDEYDFVCSKWRAARNCIYLNGGPCQDKRGQDITYTVRNGICVEDHDTCAGAACIIDIFHQRIMNMELIYKQNFEKKGCNPSEAMYDANAIIMRSLAIAGEGATAAEIDASSGGAQAQTTRNNLIAGIKEAALERDNHHCCGIAPRFTKYDHETQHCNHDGSVELMSQHVEQPASAEDEAIAGDIMDLDGFGTSEDGFGTSQDEEDFGFGDAFF